MVSLSEDLKLALDRVAFARALGLEPEGWQEELLRSTSDRVLLNCSRQSGKSTMVAIIALHQALYHPNSLILCLAPPSDSRKNCLLRSYPFTEISANRCPRTPRTS
jgi:hypothetical protein